MTRVLSLLSSGEHGRGNWLCRVSTDGQSVHDCIALLRARDGVRSLAVSFLHAYANAANEEAVARIVRDEAPDLFLSLSSAVAPEIR